MIRGGNAPYEIMARDEAVFAKAGIAEDQKGVAGLGGFSKRYIEIEYCPPGLSASPGLSVKYKPQGPSGAEAPAVSFFAGEKAYGPVLELSRSGVTGNMMSGVVAGVEVLNMTPTGDAYMAGRLHTDQYLRETEITGIPEATVQDVFDLWYVGATGPGGITVDANPGDVWAHLHQGGDPGDDKYYKLLDWEDGSGGAGGLLPAGDCGAILYMDNTGNWNALPPDVGDGYNFLRSQGICLPPEWVDIRPIIQAITGGESWLISFFYVVPLPAMSVATAVAFATGDSEDLIYSVPVPAMAETTAVTFATGDSEDVAYAIPIPTYSMSAGVV